ncbi:hypothetical protein D3C81_2147910 [compost metagenome]
MLIQYVDVRRGVLHAVEQLDALRLAHRQDLSQVEFLQGIGVQVQGAVVTALFAEVAQHCVLITQGDQIHRACL